MTTRNKVKSNKDQVNIGKMKSMNDFAVEDLLMEEGSKFPTVIYKILPDILKPIPDEHETEQEKAMALFSSIVLISGVLPGYYTKYAGKRYEANLYGYIIGPFGSGKGGLTACKELIMPIQREMTERNRVKQEINDVDKTEAMLIIPANNTKSNFYKILLENHSRGIIVETETDTVSAANKSEHGNFSDLLRVAFEHETLSMSRKTSGTIVIQRPCLTILLSSTENQLKKLIPDIENGLFSQFLFFRIQSDRTFKDVFDPNRSKHQEMMTLRGELLVWLYEELSNLDDESTLRMSKTLKVLNVESKSQQFTVRYLLIKDV